MASLERMIERQAKLHKIPLSIAKAQIETESAFKADAVSICGAIGLLQIMPTTAAGYEIAKEELFEPELNLQVGFTHLRYLFNLPKIAAVSSEYRWPFALAAYNGGQAYTYQALAIARRDLALPYSYSDWFAADKPTGDWEHWNYTKNRYQFVKLQNGKKPDYKQILNYVKRINDLCVDAGWFLVDKRSG